jgi:heme exporter protein C
MLSENKVHLRNSLSLLSVVLILAALAVVLWYAPLEQTMGWVQKVFYFHVSSAWVGMLAFLLALFFGIKYLNTKDLKWDRALAASVEIGLLFTITAILSGSIWARPIWNTWWTWDPRLTSVTIMAFTYVALLLLRRSTENREKQARFSAIYAIIGFISVPLTFYATRLLRTIHPVIFSVNQADMALTPPMLIALIISLIAFTCVFAAFLLQRLALAERQTRLEYLEAQRSHEGRG